MSCWIFVLFCCFSLNTKQIKGLRQFGDMLQLLTALEGIAQPGS